MKILPGMYLRIRKHWLSFGSHPRLDRDQNFWKDFSILQERAFPHVGSYLWKSWYMKILSRMYLWTRKSPLILGRHPEFGNRDFESPDCGCGLRIRVGGSPYSPSPLAFFCVHLHFALMFSTQGTCRIPLQWPASLHRNRRCRYCAWKRIIVFNVTSSLRRACTTAFG